jgi:adenylate cyclase class 2
MLEREVKLRFDTPEQARAAVTAARATPLRSRRLQHDILFDTVDGQLRRDGSALRLRHEDDRGVITFKGPVVPSTMKVRPEHETAIESAAAMRQVLEGLGFRAWFTYEKYREEYSLPGVVIAIDETPIGTFVEVEGTEADILTVTARLGRSPDAFVLASYRSLFVEHSAGADGDMVFSVPAEAGTHARRR